MASSSATSPHQDSIASMRTRLDRAADFLEFLRNQDLEFEAGTRFRISEIDSELLRLDLQLQEFRKTLNLGVQSGAMESWELGLESIMGHISEIQRSQP